ncbi:MAG: class I tRNA ligase family protein, partial [Desulfatitalea sp.]|nr:class I tRNA ligase family protein [Desulfatitalea sp.]
RTRIVPEVWAKTYYDWMFNIKDWCISRPIWWGHQIPAWTCQGCDELVVTMTAPGQCPKCGGRELVQETDVLDTWFSSALWPFSTMGWPERTPLLGTFYPTSVLVTGFDILFFWVARMMMMGIHFMGEVPFRDVYVHALVRDEEGKKMSKSKGNVIDPLDVIETYGTDAFRYTLAAFAAQGRDVKLSEKRVEGYRNFINKLWNAARFSLMHLEQGYARIDSADLSLPDRWILARLSRMIQQVTVALDEYKFNEAAGAAYQFVWHEFCDWYVEAAKPALYAEDRPEAREAARQTLWTVLRDILVVLHPFAPFITEETWEKLPGTDGSIMRAAFPQPQSTAGENATQDEVRMNLIMETITAIRTIRGEMNIPPAAKLYVTAQAPQEEVRQTLTTHQDLVVNLARPEHLGIEVQGQRSPTAATAILGDTVLLVAPKGVIDFAQERQRLEKEIGKLNKDLSAINNKLNNDSFLGKAPPEVVAEVREKQTLLSDKQHKLTATLERIRALDQQ